MLQLWDVATGQELWHGRGPREQIYSFAFSPDGTRLATGVQDGTCLVWDISSTEQKRPKSKPVDDEQIQKWWNDLAGTDAKQAHQAIWGLTNHPEQALRLLREKVHSISMPLADEVEKQIAALGDASFAKREAAAKALEQFEELARPALEKAIAQSSSAEARRRAESLLNRPSITQYSDKRRLIRAVEVLEQITTPESIQLLKLISKGAPEDLATRATADAITRVEIRGSK